MRKRAVAAVWTSVLLGCRLSAYADWSTYQNDAAHDGYVPGLYGNSIPTIRWSTTLPSGSLTGMAVGGGNVYVSSNVYYGSATTPDFYALNTNTGAVSWQYSMGSTYSVNAPAYINGAAYVQETGGPNGPYLYGFNASNGNVNFQSVFSTQSAGFLAPTPVGSALYMVGGYNGGMYAYNLSGGAQRWLGSIPQYYGWTPTVANGLCYAYTGSFNLNNVGSFTILNASNGATVSTTADNNFSFSGGGYYMNQAPALGSAHDAFDTNGGRLLKFGTTSTGGLLATATDQYSGQPSVAHGTVYVDDGTLTTLAAVSESTLTPLWTWTPPDGGVMSRTNIVTDNLIIASTNADVYGISLSGQTEWSLPVSGNLALSGNTLYVSSGDGTVTAISLPEPGIGLVMIGGLATLSRRRRRV